MDAGTNKEYELHCNMRAVVKFYCLRGKIPTKTFKKNEICLWEQLSELNASVRIAQGNFGKERNSWAVQ